MLPPQKKPLHPRRFRPLQPSDKTPLNRLEDTILSVPDILPIRNDDANFELVSKYLQKLTDKEQLELNTLSRKVGYRFCGT